MRIDKLLGMLIVMAALMLGVGGCADKPQDKSGEKGDKTSSVSSPADSEVAQGPHSGWWCKEHGIPEDECSLCSSKVAAACKAKGDWCEKHNRAASQCFICNPELADKFAKRYEAKFGKKPPAIEE